MNVQLINSALILLYVALNASGGLMIKTVINQKGEIPLGSAKQSIMYFLHLFANPIVLLSLVFIFGSALAWMATLSRLNISVAYPIAVALNFLVVLAVAILSFKEPFTIKQVIAVLMIIGSIVLLYK